MGIRYTSRTKKNLNTETDKKHKNLLSKRGRRRVNHFTTAKLKHPSSFEISQLTTVGHVWKAGDRFYKLAHEHYGDSKLWWVIAWFNQKPTESHVDLGDTLQIPFPIDSILSKLGV